MKNLIIIAISLFTVSAFAGITDCEKEELNDSVEACYSTSRTQHGKYTSSSIVNYHTEFLCTKTTTIQGDSYKDARLMGKYAVKSHTETKTYPIKKTYTDFSYCKSIADQVETNGVYPGFLDRADTYGEEVLGMKAPNQE